MNGKSIPSEFSKVRASKSRWHPTWRGPIKWRRWFLFLFVLLAVCVFVEIQTSVLQSWIFTRTNQEVHYKIAPGASPSIAFPRGGPLDERRGYSKLGNFRTRLENQGYRVVLQAQQSEMMVFLLNRKVSPPYREPVETGMAVAGADHLPLFQYAQGDFLFKKAGDIPALISKTLLFLENRDLDRPATDWQNPVIEWNRMLKAMLYYIGAKLQLPVPVQGGSTLAVQLEKFRHSPNGRTDTPLEKLRQVFAASLKAYRAGKNTREWREQLIVDYLNSVPLAAAPGYGEIHGLGEGLYAWFGTSLNDAVRAIEMPGITVPKVRAFKQILSLLVSVRSPSVFLVEERESLEEKVGQFTRLMAREGLIDWEFATVLQETPVQFLGKGPVSPQASSVKNKAANAIRTTMMEYLGLTNLYDLNRLHLEVESTIDVPLQKKVTDFLDTLTQPEVVRANGLTGKHLIEDADPKKVIYSFLLVEPTAEGNKIRVQADNLASPLDFNKSVKLELGSTAKLRTVAHYLELIAELHKDLWPLDEDGLKKTAETARDPLTKWAAEALLQSKKIALEPFLELAMNRRFSASPWEQFYTGGGMHTFENFDKYDNERILPLREAFRNSTNLVFIRLMRELVYYHRARLDYNADELLADPENERRKKMLQELANEESTAILRRAFQNYRGQAAAQIAARLLDSKANIERHLAILFFAWKIGSDEAALAQWLKQNQIELAEDDVSKLFQAYANPRLTLLDYAYLLGFNPLDLWCAGEFRQQPNLTWEQLYTRSDGSRQLAARWLLNPNNRRAQESRLRTRLEKEAFARMTPYWQRLGFPFKTLVPSYATAIGSSSDRPTALAELVGIIVNDGVRRQPTSLTHIHFAAGTPYETHFEQQKEAGKIVLAPEVARVVRKAMAAVVEDGTARTLQGVFKTADGKPIPTGGKTGSGDNRFETYNRFGAVTSSRATNRTATLVFYIGDRYYGVVTAYVQGREAINYKFTSALPVTVLRLLAPAIMEKMNEKTGILNPAAAQTPEKIRAQKIDHPSAGAPRDAKALAY